MPAGPERPGARRAARRAGRRTSGADDQPDPAELGGELAQVGEGEAEAEHGERREAADGQRGARAAEAPARGTRRLAGDREAPGEAVGERPAQEQQEREDSKPSQRWPWW
jgi:hypothetical protein